MVSLDLKDYEPPNPFEHAANALDPLSFIAKWPKKTREARLTVVKVLLALRDIENVPGGSVVEDAAYVLDPYGMQWPAGANQIWQAMVDAILKDAPPELLEAAGG